MSSETPGAVMRVRPSFIHPLMPPTVSYVVVVGAKTEADELVKTVDHPFGTYGVLGGWPDLSFTREEKRLISMAVVSSAVAFSGILTLAWEIRHFLH